MNMRLGENIGELLLEIAQTNIKKGEPDKAIETYTKSFHGFTEEYALSVLKNQYVLIVTEDGSVVKLSDDKDKIELNAKNLIDWNGWVRKSVSEFDEIRDQRIHIMKEFNKVSNLDIENYNIINIVKDYYGEDASMVGIHHIAAKLIANKGFAEGLTSNGEDTWERVVYKVENNLLNANKCEKMLYWTVSYVNIIRELHKSFISFANTYNWLEKNKFVQHFPFIENTLESIIHVLDKFSNTNTGYYHPMCDEDVYDFKTKINDDLLNTCYGKQYLRDKILPKNIMDGYDAGWLSPEGEFYGENGETNTMIHLRIADELFLGKYNDQMSKDDVSSWGHITPERWLETHGWIKIHHDSVYGYFKDDLDDDDEMLYCPTDIQIKMICEYANKFYKGLVYTEPTVFGSRTHHPEPYRTFAIKQMDKFRLHEIFTF